MVKERAVNGRIGWAQTGRKRKRKEIRKEKNTENLDIPFLFSLKILVKIKNHNFKADGQSDVKFPLDLVNL